MESNKEINNTIRYNNCNYVYGKDADGVWHRIIKVKTADGIRYGLSLQSGKYFKVVAMILQTPSVIRCYRIQSGKYFKVIDVETR